MALGTHFCSRWGYPGGVGSLREGNPQATPPFRPSAATLKSGSSPGCRLPRCPSSTVTDRRLPAVPAVTSPRERHLPGTEWWRQEPTDSHVVAGMGSRSAQMGQVLWCELHGFSTPRALQPNCPEVPRPRGKPRGPSFRLNNHPSTGQGPNQLSNDLPGEHLGRNLNKELTPSKLSLVLAPLRGELERQLSDGRARRTVGHGRNSRTSASEHPRGATAPDTAHRL